MDSYLDDKDKKLEKYVKLYSQIYDQFIGCPFDISCIDKIEELDNIFTNEKMIWIRDNRININNNYYSSYSNKDIDYNTHFLQIKKIDNNPITLRQILKQMSICDHYNNDIIKKDPHHFLELFRYNGLNIYTTIFGS